MVIFIHNGSEITTWMVYNFKTKRKSTKSQAKFLRKTSLLNFKLQIIRLAQRNWSSNPTHKISYFYSYNNEKIYLAVHFTKGCFFCKFVCRKLMGLVQNYLLPACWRYKQDFYFLPHTIKI